MFFLLWYICTSLFCFVVCPLLDLLLPFLPKPVLIVCIFLLYFNLSEGFGSLFKPGDLYIFLNLKNIGSFSPIFPLSFFSGIRRNVSFLLDNVVVFLKVSFLVSPQVVGEFSWSCFLGTFAFPLYFSQISP